MKFLAHEVPGFFKQANAMVSNVFSKRNSGL